MPVFTDFRDANNSCSFVYSMTFIGSPKGDGLVQKVQCEMFGKIYDLF